MAAPLKKPPTPRSPILVGGLLGGILGTSGMILVGIVAEWGAGVPLSRLTPELELGFGGPFAGAGVLGSGLSLPVHYLHGMLLGLVFAWVVWLGERLGLAPRIPLSASGLLFGGIVSTFVVALLAATAGGPLSPGVVGLVGLLHLTFGGLTGATLERVRGGHLPDTGNGPPR
ncbi:MAG: hypothetical protein L3K14_00965 [Thermoplasmata archaeon]|nr:hypothetical protein [Thermoplasmata archaeon]